MTKNNISIRNLSPERATIDIEGTIGVDENMQFSNPGQRVATYEKLSDTLVRISEIDAPEVVVNIRSTGGDVNDALLIYEALKSLRGRVVTCCYGYTASAATVIAQAASPGCRRIASGALYLIHNSVCATEGNAAELAASTDLLRKTDERLAALYAERSGASVEGFVALMAENNGAGRWLSPDEAVKAGLADEVIDDPHREETPQGQKVSAAGDKGVGNTAEVPADGPETEPAKGACTAEIPADGSETESETEVCTADGLSEPADAAEASSEKSAGTSGTAAAEEHIGCPAGKPAGASAEKSVEKTVGTAAVASAEKNSGCPAGKPADAAEKSVGASVGTSADAAQKSAEKPVAGWKTLLRQLRNLFAGSGKKETEGRGEAFRTAAPPADKNILHTDDPDPLHEMIRSRIAFNRGQNAVKPTATQPVEDPAACDSRRSANQRAYAEDARRICL